MYIIRSIKHYCARAGSVRALSIFREWAKNSLHFLNSYKISNPFFPKFKFSQKLLHKNAIKKTGESFFKLYDTKVGIFPQKCGDFEKFLSGDFVAIFFHRCGDFALKRPGHTGTNQKQKELKLEWRNKFYTNLKANSTFFYELIKFITLT